MRAGRVQAQVLDLSLRKKKATSLITFAIGRRQGLRCFPRNAVCDGQRVVFPFQTPKHLRSEVVPTGELVVDNFGSMRLHPFAIRRLVSTLERKTHCPVSEC